MQNKYEQNESFEIEAKSIPTAPADIADYIAKLPEPEREICRSLIFDQATQTTLAKRYNLSIRRIGKLIRTALAPLAEEYGIKTQSKGNSEP